MLSVTWELSEYYPVKRRDTASDVERGEIHGESKCFYQLQV